MHLYFALLRRELGSYFSSLIGYVIIGMSLFLIGICFSNLLETLNTKPTDVPVTELFFKSWYFWLILLLATPLLTMRSYALEKSTGTFETLTTTPVGEWEIVLAKFSSALVIHILVWLPLMLCLLGLRWYASDVVAAGVGTVASTFLGILLIGACYLAMGCFASSLTSSQSIAAMLSFALGAGMFLLSYWVLYAPDQLGTLAVVLSRYSLIDHVQDFARGVLDTRNLVFYASLILMFLYLTLKVLESRRWK
jgi:ABC-2 type transport system permease protein